MKITQLLRNSKCNLHFVLLNCMMFFFLSGVGLHAQEEAATDVFQKKDPNKKWVLVIHGGAGNLSQAKMAREGEYKDKLEEALKEGSEILANGGSSLDAVEKVVRLLEDSPLFNAGKGSVLNENGMVEMDAAIMDGRTGKAGAVTGVTSVKNPVTAARLVMDKTNCVMLSGAGAENCAREFRLEMLERDYFITPERLEEWKLLKEKENGKPVHEQNDKEKHGTVGAVALDLNGDLAAATSTGGIAGKMAGRIGDSPIIGAGTYANNNTCAVSCTGQGENFIRNVVAYDLSAIMEYQNSPLEQAANILVMKTLAKKQVEGGLIAVDRQGNIAMPFNTKAMYRGYVKSSGEREVSVY
jgi:L-asparaginase / beta-aspartyl-peptidase